MMERLKGRTGQWGLASAAALTGLAAWLALNSSRAHVHVLAGQTALGWPSSWLESLLLMPALVAGLVVMMVPCVLQMSIVFAAVTAGVSAAGSGGEASAKLGGGTLVQTGLFVLGYVAFYSSLGASLGAFGQGLAVLGDTFLAIMRVIGGLLIAALGLHLSGLLKLGVAAYCRGPVAFLLAVEPKGRFGSFRAGIAFAIYCVGCCGPYILAILAIAAASGSAILSGALLLFFSLGMAIPFVMIAISYKGAARYLEASSRRAGTVSRISGTVLIVFGAMMVLVGSPFHGY